MLPTPPPAERTALAVAVVVAVQALALVPGLCGLAYSTSPAGIALIRSIHPSH